MRLRLAAVICGWAAVALLATPAIWAQDGHGSIIGWGAEMLPEVNTGLVAVASGYEHNVGLKTDGSIVAWGRNDYGECNVPAANQGYVAITAGMWHSLGLIGHPRGDLNCDGRIDVADIDPFMLALSDLAACQAAYPSCDLLNGDINADGLVDFGDIDPFVALLSAG